MPPRILQINDRTTGSEQVQSLFRQAQPPTAAVSKQMSSTQCQTEISLEFVAVCQVPEAPFGLIADARVGGTPVRALVDTGATINLIRSDVYSRLTAAPALRTYKGSLERADGRAVNVDGWITSNMELGSIDVEIEALVVPELKAEVIQCMRSLDEYDCSLDFHCDNLWTWPKEGSTVPLHYEPLRATSPGPSAVPDSQNPAEDVTETLPQQPTCGPGDLVEGWSDDEEDHFVQMISNGDEVDLQAQAERHLEEDVQKNLELAAGAERDRLRELTQRHVRPHRCRVGADELSDPSD